MKCAACKGVYHPATGHVLSEQLVLCGPCTREHVKWLKQHLRRKWGGADFYAAAATSVKAK